VNGDKMRSRYGVKCVFGNETRLGVLTISIMRG
jgi:hypothetical protein